MGGDGVGAASVRVYFEVVKSYGLAVAAGMYLLGAQGVADPFEGARAGAEREIGGVSAGAGQGAGGGCACLLCELDGGGGSMRAGGRADR